jgi:hypothetical protein
VFDTVFDTVASGNIGNIMSGWPFWSSNGPTMISAGHGLASAFDLGNRPTRNRAGLAVTILSTMRGEQL